MRALTAFQGSVPYVAEAFRAHLLVDAVLAAGFVLSMVLVLIARSVAFIFRRAVRRPCAPKSNSFAIES